MSVFNTAAGAGIVVQPGYTRDKVGFQTFILIATYLNFPTIIAETQFTLEVTDTGCALPPKAEVFVPFMKYVIGDPTTTALVGYPKSDVCGNFVVMAQTKWLHLEPLMAGETKVVVKTDSGLDVGLH